MARAKSCLGPSDAKQSQRCTRATTRSEVYEIRHRRCLRQSRSTTARNLLELAQSFEPVQDGRISIEKINAPMPYEHKAKPAEYKAGLDLASNADGWICMRAYVCKLHPDRRGPVRIEKPRLEAGVWFNCRGAPVRSLGLFGTAGDGVPQLRRLPTRRS